MKPRSVLRVSVFLIVVVALAAVALTPPSTAWAGAELGFDVRFNGVVQTVGSQSTPWLIGGQSLVTDANTQVFENAAPAVGIWADVAAKRQVDGSLLAKQITLRPEQPRLRGPLQSKPDDSVGDWVIAGVTVKVTADTKIGARGQAIKVGGWVEAVMEETGGVLTAKNIIGTGAADAVIVNGELQSFSETEWVISSIPVAVSTAAENGTLISGKPGVGLIVHAAAQLEEDNSLTGQVLRVSWIDQNSLAPVVELEGKIEKLPTTGLRGEWTVDGQTVLVMPNTRIHQEKGLAVVGATVHVSGWDILGQIVAGDIAVLQSPDTGGSYVRFGGLIEALPASGTTGEWKVGGKTIVVTSQTQLFGTPQVGQPAGVEGIQRADGSIVATAIRVRALPPNLPTPRPTRIWRP